MLVTFAPNSCCTLELAGGPQPRRRSVPTVPGQVHHSFPQSQLHPQFQLKCTLRSRWFGLASADDVASPDLMLGLSTWNHELSLSRTELDENLFAICTSL